MASKQEYLNMMKRMEMMQGKGALGSLPTRTGGSMSDTEANMFDADRTQSLDMQKEAMGT